MPRGIRLPHRRGRTEGNPIYYVVKGEKAYLLADFSWLGSSGEAGDCMVEMAEGLLKSYATITPIEGKGCQADNTAEILVALASQPSSLYYVVFFVFSDNDSIRSFQKLKETVLNREYRYVLFPTEPGDSFRVSPTSFHEAE